MTNRLSTARHTQANLFDTPAEALPSTPASGGAADVDIAKLADQFAALSPAWRDALSAFTATPDFARLCRFVDGERAQHKTIYPRDVFRALRLIEPRQVKVVILGQDPYHGEDAGLPQAHGLAFSVPPGVRPPPSLKNIFKEIQASLALPVPTHGCLDSWAQQGVLLLNTVLTVEAGRAASHAKQGWEACTDALIRHLSARREGLVFMLWGAHAQAKRVLLDAGRHTLLEAPHPSPLSAHRGFLGCNHFALANQALLATGQDVIDWRLPDRATLLG
jgi:uracil-DNA glycosylase